MQPTPMMIYSEEKMDRLYRAALRVLRETGFRIDHDEFLDRFERRGVKVDRTQRRVSITEDLINELLTPRPDLRWRDKAPECSPCSFGLGGSYPRYYDWPTRTSCPGATKQLLELIRAFSTIPEFKALGRVLTLHDVPQVIEPIIATALVIKHSPSPAGGEVYLAHNVPYLVELGEIVTGRPRCADYVPSCTFVVPPLKMTGAEGDLILEKAQYDLPAVAGTMPSCGATAPVTREGTVVIELAEVIAIWLCYRLVAPDVRLGAICASSSFDMKEGTCSFSSPEAVLQDCAAAQILRTYFNADARTSSGYVDAKVPGIQAVYEKVFKAWWAFQFQGATALATGLLQAGQAFSPAQALVDMDVWNTVNALFKEEPSIHDEIPFDDIHNVATSNGTFLDTDHTVRRFRDVLHIPQFLDRSPRRSDAEEASKADRLLDRAQQRYEEAKKTAREYTAPAHVCQAVDRVVEQAKKALL